jgi:PadR family transcriptional regulator PadR
MVFICRTSRCGRLPDKSELLQGTLDLLLLKVIALGPIHGYAITQRLRQISKEVLQVQQGSLYPALHRLQTRGLVQAEWAESESGRQARFYKLTAKGKKHLVLEERTWQRMANAIALVLRTAE